MVKLLPFSRNCNPEDASRTNQAIKDKFDEIMAKVEQCWHLSSHDIAKELKIHHKTVLNHLEKAGYKKKLYKELDIKRRSEILLPHDAMQKNSFKQPSENIQDLTGKY